MTLHYLDNAATTWVLPQAAQAALCAMTEQYGNPSALHQLGQGAKAALEEARGQVAAALVCPPERIIFTSCGTESTVTALQNAARRGKRVGRHIVTSAIEHKATQATLQALAQEGFAVTTVPPGRDGIISPESVLAALRPDTILVTLTALCSETGSVLDLPGLLPRIKQLAPQCQVHIDGVQAFCKLPLPLDGVDYMSLSGHKIGACKGVGALYCATPRQLAPLLPGGGQESGLRSGTEGMPQICSFGAACTLRAPARENALAHVGALRARLLAGLSALPCPVAVNSPTTGSPYIVNLSPAAGRSEVLLRVLSDGGVLVSAGSACTKGKRSAVLESMKLPASAIDSALRVSFCPENTEEDVDALLAALAQALALFV